jgi:histidyl-tRNA synthetase
MKFKTPTGTSDFFAPESKEIELLVAGFAKITEKLGYSLLLTPIFEDSELFRRGAGETTDIVTKEMYEFTDRSDRKLTLKPEGTTSAIRAFIEHSYSTPFKCWYLTPAFRYEKPQAGRYRQHHQLGIELLGPDSYFADIEVIYILIKFIESLGLKQFKLLINSMGHRDCRNLYKQKLLDYLTFNEDRLCDDHKLRYKINPLRILDCKKTECISVVVEAPLLIDYLCEDCRSHHESVLNGLDNLGIIYEAAPTLVRGFDYYSRTTFEVQSLALNSSQSAIGGGGRYDNLVASLGGVETAGIGFGIGIERLLLVMKAESIRLNEIPSCDVFIVNLAKEFLPMRLADKLLSSNIKVSYSYEQSSMKSQMRQADKSTAKIALIVGDSELKESEVTIKNLIDSSQYRCPIERVVQDIKKLLTTIESKH